VILLGAVLLFLFAPKAYSAPDSHGLTRQVTEQVRAYYSNPFKITTDSNGDVIIRGTVRTLYDKYRIFDIISGVPGVHDISDELTINTKPIPGKFIEANIREELNLMRSIDEPDRIQIHADNGEVILSGTVSRYEEKRMAETATSWQEGVRGIANNIKVLPPKEAVSDDNLQTVLGEILKHRFLVDHQVQFQVEDGVVTLKGMVPRMWDRKHIQEAFSRVQGVQDVVNLLEVRPVS